MPHDPNVPPRGFHPDDLAHVAIDAIGVAISAIIKGGAEPWDDYWGDEGDDPKMDREGYLWCLRQAEHKLEMDYLSKGRKL